MPKSFLKANLQPKIAPSWHLIGSYQMPSENYDCVSTKQKRKVPTIFMIWIRATDDLAKLNHLVARFASGSPVKRLFTNNDFRKSHANGL
jgi:hypothetical protein